MTTTTVELGNAVAARRTGSRMGALAGVAFALCLFFGVAMLEIPRHASDSEIVAWWADKANQRASVVSMYLFVLAGIAFLVFLVKLRTRPPRGGGWRRRAELARLHRGNGLRRHALRRRRSARSHRLRGSQPDEGRRPA